MTIYHQGAALTFPDIDDPAEAYRLMSNPNPMARSLSRGVVQQSSTSFNKANVPQGVDRTMLAENKDWLSASRVLYEGTQGKRFEGTDQQLADWGLDRMARFNYNLMYSGIDAVSIKNAPDDQKKAFMFLLDSFDKVSYSWGGFQNALKYLLVDPTTYVSLATFGIGAAASQGAKITTKEGVKAALRVGGFGAIEGGIFGAAQQRIEQEARVNAGGQDAVDYGRVGLGAAVGAGAGAVLAPAVSVAANALRPEARQASRAAQDALPTPGATQVVQDAPTTPAATTGAPTTAYNQAGLDLGDMNDPVAAAQVRIQRLQESGQAGSYMPGDAVSGLPSAQDAYRTVREPMLPMDLPVDPNMSRTQSTAIDLGQARLREDGSPMTTADLPYFGNVSGQNAFDTPQPAAGPRTYDGQGSLFPTNEQNFGWRGAAAYDINTREPVRGPDVYDANAFNEATGKLGKFVPGEVETVSLTGTRMKEDQITKLDDGLARADPTPRPTTPEKAKPIPPAPDEKIGQANGPSLLDLKRLLNDIASSNSVENVRGWLKMRDIVDPLTRALTHLTPNEAKDIIKQLAATAMTPGERRAFVDSLIHAQNTVADYIRFHIAEGKLATTDALKTLHRDKVLEAEKVFSPLKLLAKEAGTLAGRGLNTFKQSDFKGKLREVDVDSILLSKNIDPLRATPEQRLEAIDQLTSGIARALETAEKDTRLVDARKRIADAVGDDEIHKAWEDLALLRQQIRDEELATMSAMGRLGDSWKRAAGEVGSFAAMTVLGPSSTVVNAASNAFRTFSRPFQDYLTKGPFHREALREMLHVYGAMYSVSTRALRAAKLSFDLSKSVLTGNDGKWLERNLDEFNIPKNSVLRFMNRNFVQLWMRALNATDEFFGQMAYHGKIEGEAFYRALVEAKEKGLNRSDTDKLIKTYLKDALERGYNLNPDATTIGMLRDAGMQKGYQGEALKVWVRNQLDKNGDLLRRATDEQGISYHNDLLFKTEFSGDGALSSMAKSYEGIVQRHPELRLMGQLFFRTPVRVFEAGVRMTPIVQAAAPNFLRDLAGDNGIARQLRAQGEMLASFGFTAAVITGVATGKITGEGYDIDYREKRNLENAGWKPYSIKIGDSWVSYRNFDPFSTPIKIIANAMERLQRVEYEKAQGVYEQKGPHKELLGYMNVAFGSTLQALRDANLTAGIDDAVKFIDALSDPDKSETKFQQFITSKAQLAVPNVIRKGIRSFGEGQDVMTDPRTFDQAFTGIVNPGSETITHQYDALGFKRTNPTQGLLAYVGIDIADKTSRERGLSDKDIYSLNEVAKMSFATGKRFTPTFKSSLYPDKDLREVTAADGTTIYNKAMEEFNKNMPSYAYEFLKSTEGVPAGRRGELGPRAKEFEKLQQRIWNAAVQTVIQEDIKAAQAREKKFLGRYDVLMGVREIQSPF